MCSRVVGRTLFFSSISMNLGHILEARIESSRTSTESFCSWVGSGADQSGRVSIFNVMSLVHAAIDVSGSGGEGRGEERRGGGAGGTIRVVFLEQLLPKISERQFPKQKQEKQKQILDVFGKFRILTERAI